VAYLEGLGPAAAKWLRQVRKLPARGVFSCVELRSAAGGRVVVYFRSILLACQQLTNDSWQQSAASSPFSKCDYVWCAAENPGGVIRRVQDQQRQGGRGRRGCVTRCNTSHVHAMSKFSVFCYTAANKAAVADSGLLAQMILYVSFTAQTRFTHVV
jgi:hypothetical protein